MNHTGPAHSSAAPKQRRKIRLLFAPLTRYANFLNWLFTPFMYWVQGNYKERPQETHDWNHIRLSTVDHFWIDKIPKVVVQGDPKARRRKNWRGVIPVFRMPRFGGWRRFVVLRPVFADVPDGEVWYVGWECGRECGVSMIPLRTPVRMPFGYKEVKFFGFNSHHEPVELIKLGFGDIGKAGNFGKLPMR